MIMVCVDEIYRATLRRQHLSRHITVPGPIRLPGFTLRSLFTKLVEQWR